jgi:hypothetical protein
MIPKVIHHIHALMRNTDDVDAALAHEIEDDVCALGVTEIAFADLWPRATEVGVLRQPEEPPVNGPEIGVALLSTPGLERVTGDASQVLRGPWCDPETAPHPSLSSSANRPSRE